MRRSHPLTRGLWPLALAAMMAGPALGAAAPDIVAGPDLANSAHPVEAPIDEVLVFSDRARVIRRGALAPGRGLRTLRLPDLPGGALIETVRLSASGAKVLRVEAAPVEQDQVAIAEVEALLTAIEAIDDQRAELQMARQVLDAEADLLTRLTPIPAVKEGDPAPAPAAGVLDKVLGFLGDRRDALRQGRASLTTQDRALLKQRQEKVTALAQYDARAFTEQRVQVTAIVEITGGAPKVELEYFVPGATWRPDYEVEFDPNRGRLTLKTAGRVRQSSGEDWRGVKLGLSTAIPGAGIEAPELLTWTLGESRQFMPQPRARYRQDSSVPLPPAAAPLRNLKGQAAARLNDLRQRIRQAINGQSSVNGLLGGAPAGLGAKGTGAGGGGYGNAGGDYARAESAPMPQRKRRPAASRAAPPPPPPSPEPMMDEDDAVYEQAEMAPEASAPVQLSSAPSGSSGPRYQATRLDLFERTGPQRRLTQPDLPAVAAGGLDFTWSAATRVVVPSGPDEQRVPLAAFQAPVDLYYEVSPGVSTTAYLKGEAVNGTGAPLLAGPVRLFSGGDFVGRGQIDTVGEGGRFTLPLGADQDLQIVRTVTPSSKTEGVFSKSDVTAYNTKIQVANYKRRPIQIRVTDQIPKALKEDIKIKRTGARPEPSEGPDAEGLMRFDLSLKAGATDTIEFNYTIERPADWRLRQQ